MSPTRRLMSLLLIATAIALLYPGLTQPILTLTGSLDKSELVQMGIEMLAGDDADSQAQSMLRMMSSFLGLDQIQGQVQAYSNTRSILGTVQSLANSGHSVVAILIVVFSVIIPLFKLLLQALALALPQAQWRAMLLNFNSALSKWSMADVFVMGLLVAYMAGSASGEMGDLLTMDARLESGFYYFLAYCLFSIAAGVLMREPGAEI